MKQAPPTRAELIGWCRERAEANRGYRGGVLGIYALRMIREEWPVYFEAIADLLKRDGSNQGAVND